jgi:hypothetical protein
MLGKYKGNAGGITAVGTSCILVEIFVATACVKNTVVVNWCTNTVSTASSEQTEAVWNFLPEMQD